MDRLLRQEIVQEFRRSMEGLNERYVKAETLCEHVEVLTPDWLKRHGSCFNRTKMIWTDKTGRRHEDGHSYILYTRLSVWCRMGASRS